MKPKTLVVLIDAYVIDISERVPGLLILNDVLSCHDWARCVKGCERIWRRSGTCADQGSVDIERASLLPVRTIAVGRHDMPLVREIVLDYGAEWRL